MTKGLRKLGSQGNILHLILQSYKELSTKYLQQTSYLMVRKLDIFLLRLRTRQGCPALPPIQHCAQKKIGSTKIRKGYKRYIDCRHIIYIYKTQKTPRETMSVNKHTQLSYRIQNPYTKICCISITLTTNYQRERQGGKTTNDIKMNKIHWNKFNHGSERPLLQKLLGH